MNPQGTSFIPQRPTSGSIKKPGVKKVYVLTYISFIVFFGTIVGTAGTFAYKVLEETRLAEQKKLLTEERAKFDESELASIKELDIQMRQAQSKLDSHVSILPIFKALEESTAESIQLSSFSYERTDASNPNINFTGTAKDFNNILFQRQVLESNEIFKSALFKELALGSSGVDSSAVTSVSSNEETPKPVTFSIIAPVEAALIPFTGESMGSEDTSNSELNESDATTATENEDAVTVDTTNIQ